MGFWDFIAEAAEVIHDVVDAVNDVVDNDDD